MIVTISIGFFSSVRVRFSVAGLLAAGSLAPVARAADAELSAQVAVEAPPGEAESAAPMAARPSQSSTGFEAGLRVGAGLPLGNVGQSGGVRKLSELTPWRTPIWVDTGYRFSDALTLGLYFQVGFGGTGDACTAIACDWADLRGGIHAQWRPAGQGSVVPWIGAGLGYESFTFRSLIGIEVTDPETGEPASFSMRVSESLGGPELLLQGGLDFSVEDSLWIGPYVSATLAQYVSDQYECEPDLGDCEARTPLEGSGVHSWLGVGLRGAYSP